MIKGRIILIGVLPGINGNADRGRYTTKAHPFSCSTNAEANILQYKYHPIGPIGIAGAEVDVEFVIKD